MARVIGAAPRNTAFPARFHEVAQNTGRTALSGAVRFCVVEMKLPGPVAETGKNDANHDVCIDR